MEFCVIVIYLVNSVEEFELEVFMVFNKFILFIGEVLEFILFM